MKKSKEQSTDSLTDTLNIEIAEPRRNRAPSTAFKPGNPWAAKKGEVRNPDGRKGSQKNERLPVSKSLRVQLNSRAPAKVTNALEMPSHSSWAQCIARMLLRKTVSGDLQAATLLMQYTEGSPKQHLTLEDGPDGGARRQVRILFMNSDGDGRPVRTLPTTEDGYLADEPAVMLPAPTE